MSQTRYARSGLDLEELKQANPIQDVVERFGIELRRQGRCLVGRCPLHADGGRPNLHLWPDSNSWWCFRCSVGGDAIRFVELAQHIPFNEAVELLRGACVGILTAQAAGPRIPRRRVASSERQPDELLVLEAATSFYHRHLLTDQHALASVEARGLGHAAIQQHRIGYARGGALLPYLRWRSLPLRSALSVGLLDASGQEFFAGRIVVPEIRSGQAIWLVGRSIDAPQVSAEDGEVEAPKYLGLRGAKPLLGLEHARASTTVIATEGVFDYLTLSIWGYPSVALMGTHTSRQVLEDLRSFERIYLVLDQDEAGIGATLRLASELGPSAIPVALPGDVKDVADLATRSDGREVFAATLLEFSGGLPLPATIATVPQPLGAAA